MNESYAEAGCKKRDTVSTYLVKGLLVFLVVSSILATLLLPLFAMIAIIVISVSVVFYRKLDVEYEYIFCDGQIDFDRITAGRKRKTMKKIDFDQVEICAPLNSHALDNYKNQDFKEIDFASHAANVTTYAVIVRDQGNMSKILFEPNEKMLECIRAKAPRKIVFE